MKCLWEKLKNKPTDTSIYKEIVIIIYQKLTGKVNKGRRNLARGQRGGTAGMSLVRTVKKLSLQVRTQVTGNTSSK